MEENKDAVQIIADKAEVLKDGEMLVLILPNNAPIPQMNNIISMMKTLKNKFRDRIIFISESVYLRYVSSENYINLKEFASKNNQYNRDNMAQLKDKKDYIISEILKLTDIYNYNTLFEMDIHKLSLLYTDLKFEESRNK